MAIHNVIGDGFRGATWISIHNGGGVGWGEVINGGFGMLLDGSDDSDRRLKMMLHWDVNNGIARRSWARNEGAMFAIKREMERTPNLKVTLPNLVDDSIVGKNVFDVGLYIFMVVFIGLIVLLLFVLSFFCWIVDFLWRYGFGLIIILGVIIYCGLF